MLRTWLPCASLLRLLLLLALPPLLPRQQRTLIARSSSLYNGSFPCHNFFLWLGKSSNRHPTVAIAAALSIFVPRASSSATGLAHLNKNLLLRKADLLDYSRHQNSCVRSPESQHRFLSSCSRAGAQHIAATQTPCARLGPLAEYFAASCCSCFPAQLKSSCIFVLLRTVVRKGSNRRRSNVLLQWQQRPHDGSRAYRDIARTCAAVRSALFTLISPPVAAFSGADTTQQLPAVFHSFVASPRQIPLMFTTCHGRGQRKPQICCCCVRLDSQCTTPPVTSPCRACRRNVFHVRFANAAHPCKTWGRKRTSRCCCYCSRTFPASFLRRRDVGTCFTAPTGTAPSFRAAAAALNRAPARRIPASPSAATSAGGGTPTKEASKSSARERIRQFLAAVPSTSLFALSEHERFVTSLSTHTRVTKPLAAFEGTSIQRATSRVAVVGTVALALEMTTPLSSTEALHAVFRGASSPSQSKQTSLFFSLASLPSSSETTSYPFRSIEEKWVRYYAEHPEDYSPPLPDERLYTGETSSFCPSVENPASYTCATAVSHLTTTGLVSRISEAKDPRNRLRACSDNAPRKAVLAEAADDVDLYAASHKQLFQSSNRPPQDKYEAAATTARDARVHNERVDDNALVPEASTKAVDIAEEDLKMTNSASASDRQCSTDTSRAAALLPRERYPSQRLQQDEEGFNRAVRTACGASFEPCDNLKIDAKTAAGTQRGLKQARRGDMQTQEATFLDGKDKQRAEAKTAAPADSTGEEKKSNKFYILSMIPYPSGEGLHVGHCLTYTIADVVARYKRLQLRGELLRDQERAEELNRFGGDSAEAEKRERVQQQGRQQHRTDQKMERHLQKERSIMKLSSVSATNASEEAQNGKNVSSCNEQPVKRENHEQAMFRQKSEKGEEPVRPLPTQGVVACLTDNSSGQEYFGSRRGFGGIAPTATGQSCKGIVTLNQAEKEKQQTTLQQPNVMHVMGWDAFGLPAEQHALVSGIPPHLSVCKNVGRFRRQLQRLGLCVDWRREINTSDPEYFRWTQWIFLQMWKRGLVYEKAANVNWCEALGTVLADEEVVNGVSNRGHHPVERRCLKQWHLRITTYADELLKSLDSLDWPDDVKVMQRNWIGKRDLLYMILPLLSSPAADRNDVLALEGEDMRRQATPEHAGGRETVTYKLPQCDIFSACGAAKSKNHSSQNEQKKWHCTVLPVQSDQVDTDAAVELRSADYAGSAGQEDKKSCTLRCVSVSPEFLFGVTFVVMHARHKQAHAAALSLAAREWLARQNCQHAVEQECHPFSFLHVGTDNLDTKEQKSPTASEERIVDLVEADILTGLESEATMEGKDEENVTIDSHGLGNVSKVSSSFVKKESVFSGSYLKHPLTEAALPVWLFSGKLFDQLRGAGTYFNQHDAVLVVPGQDSVAERFARAAGLPVTYVLASKPDKADAPHRKTFTAGRYETVRPHYREDVVPGKTTDCCLQDVIINSHSERLTVNGLSRGQARRRILEHLVARGIGEQQSGFALRDWVFSRQRLWGEPIPLIRAHALDHGRSSVFAESETNLPITLPEEMIGRRGDLHKRCRSQVHAVAQRMASRSSFGEHTCNKNAWPVEGQCNSGEERTSAKNNNRYLQRCSLMAPLAHYPQWWDITHLYDADTPKKLWSMQRTREDVRGPVPEREAEKMAEKRTKVELQREVSTMPQWAGSSWYFLRFLDPHNTREAFKKEAAQYWMPVDLYVGGKEHAVTHLLYARFWHKVLRDTGCVDCGEPFERLCTPGIVLGTPQYVAFQRLDTGEWVSASNVSLKKNEYRSESDILEKQLNSNSSTKQGVTAEMTFSASTLETAFPVNAQPGSQAGAFCRDKSGFETNAYVATTARETADTSVGRSRAHTAQQDVVVGVHNPSGQPVRAVTVKKTAILHVKESDVPVLKENENIEAVCRYEKMSKSRGNVISPDSLINAYGADALRLHLLFLGPIEARKVWSLGGIRGISRFLNRMWHLITSGRKTDVQQTGDCALSPTEDSNTSLPDVAGGGVRRDHSLQRESLDETGKKSYSRRTGGHTASLPTRSGEQVTMDCAETEQATRSPLWNETCSQLQNSRLSAFEKTLLKQLIERVTRHVERLAFNTALAALMCAVRKLSQWKGEGNALSVHTALILVRLLHPFAPFITEELWYRVHERFPNVSRCGSNPSLLACGIWPTDEDSEINASDRANDESNAARKRRTCTGIARDTVPTVNVGVYVDGKFQVKVHMPAGYVNDKVALEEYVKRDYRVSQILEKKKVLRSIVVLKGTLVNFVTKQIRSSGDESQDA